MSAAALWPFVALGLLGTLHCAGMCGGFALLVRESTPAGRGRLLRHHAAYVVGKALTYGVCGLALALVGARLAGTEHDSVVLVRTTVAVAAGLLLIAMGLERLGLLAWPGGRTGGGRVVAGLRRLFDLMRSLPGASGALGTGLVNGLLPCGLSLAALALASQVAPPTAFAGAFLFGIASSPALVAVGLVPMGRRTRRAVPVLTGLALLVFGALTLWRARGAHGGDAAPCCQATVAADEPGDDRHR